MGLSGLSRVQKSPVSKTVGWGTESSMTEARPPRVSLGQEGASTGRCEVCGEAPLGRSERSPAPWPWGSSPAPCHNGPRSSSNPSRASGMTVPPGRRVGGQHSAQRGLWPRDVVREHVVCRWMGEHSPSHCDGSRGPYSELGDARCAEWHEVRGQQYVQLRTPVGRGQRVSWAGGAWLSRG